MKTCEGPCGLVKSFSEFHRNAWTADGYEYRCKVCAPRGREPVDTPEESRQRNLARIKERYRADVAFRARVQTNRRLSTYGITRAQFDALVESQGGVCVGCQQTPDRWEIDHDHRCCPGKKSCGRCIRGLLCRLCNATLGLARDDAPRLTRLADYLQAPPAAEALCGVTGVAVKHGRSRTAEHGTLSGYSRHIKDKTEVCPPCREAKREHDTQKRREAGVKPHDSQHGTYGGAQKHRRKGEDPCPPCLDAENAYRREAAAKKRLEVDPAWKPRVAECGTVSGYNRHRRLGEECAVCKAAASEYAKEYRERRKAVS